MSSDDVPPDRDAMEALFDEVLKSPVTRCATDFLFRARLLLRITDDDPLAARAVILEPAGREAAGREYETLTDEDRDALERDVAADWTMCASHAISRLWHACSVLDIDPGTLDADHVALTAATLLSGQPGPFAVDNRGTGA